MLRSDLDPFQLFYLLNSLFHISHPTTLFFRLHLRHVLVLILRVLVFIILVPHVPLLVAQNMERHGSPVNDK